MTLERCSKPAQWGYPCNLPKNHTANTCQSCVWQVTRLVDLGERMHYRYSIGGWVLDGYAPPRPFFWGVPDLDDPRFDVSSVGL